MHFLAFKDLVFNHIENRATVQSLGKQNYCIVKYVKINLCVVYYAFCQIIYQISGKIICELGFFSFSITTMFATEPIISIHYEKEMVKIHQWL